MAYTTDNNFPLLPTGAVDWVALVNDLINKIEVGRTISRTAAANIARYQCFYIDSAGKAAVATASTDIIGIWQTVSTVTDATGFGQIDGTMTYGSWAWTPGTFLYSGASGALTATPSASGKRIAYALTATKILLLSNFMSVYTASKALVTDASGNVSVSSVTAAELGYIAGVTSAIQTQLNAKAPTASPTFSGTITTPLTASRALMTGASSELAVSSVTATELGYVAGGTSTFQTQINTKAPSASPAFTGDVSVEKTIVTPGTTGAQTINKTAGRVNFAAAATSLVVTNSLVTTNSIILATAATTDATGYVVSCVPASGSFTINVIAPTAEMAVNWIVIN